MSEFLRKLEETLHFPDRLLAGLHLNTSHGVTSPEPREYSGSGKEARPPSPHGVTRATCYSHPPTLAAPLRSISEYRIMDRPGETERSQQQGGGGKNQPKAQGSTKGDYYEPAAQVGGGSVAGGGGSMQARMQYGEGKGQEGQKMEIAPMHLSELVPAHPHHISQGKETEGHTQQHRGTEQQAQPQRSANLPKDLGAAQVKPGPEGSYPNPTAGGGGGVGYGKFPGAQPTKKSAGGARDREGEHYGRAKEGYKAEEEHKVCGPGDIGLAAHRDIEGPHLYEMEGAGQRELGRFQTAQRVFHPEEIGGDEPECHLHGPGDIGLAAHRDVDGPHEYEMEGVGEREPGREQLAHRVYSPAPPDLGKEPPEEDAAQGIGYAGHRDVDGPHPYEMEGVGRREEGRAPLLREYAKTHPSQQAQEQETQGTEKKAHEQGTQGTEKKE